MAELEQALARLAAQVEWPATPAFALRRVRRRRWLVAVALVLLALAIAFAVPPARSAILRFLDIGGVRIERVDTLPAAQERPLADALGGVPATAAEARELLGVPFRAPNGLHPQLYRSGLSVSALLATPEPVLLTELRTGVGSGVIVKKLVGASTNAAVVELEAGVPAVWIHGASHYLLAPPLPPRLAGNTLIWVRGAVTYRLEGKALSLARARKLAREIP
jgi:hypothetical protein